jgi:hypothetical protein
MSGQVKMKKSITLVLSDEELMEYGKTVWSTHAMKGGRS